MTSIPIATFNTPTDVPKVVLPKKNAASIAPLSVEAQKETVKAIGDKALLDVINSPLQQLEVDTVEIAPVKIGIAKEANNVLSNEQIAKNINTVVDSFNAENGTNLPKANTENLLGSAAKNIKSLSTKAKVGIGVAFVAVLGLLGLAVKKHSEKNQANKAH